MGFHGCPIEPSDWSDGPNEPPECPECCGECQEDDGVSCSRCGGLGYLEDDYEYDPAEWYDPEDKA